jgi:hypothetical protein
MNEVEGEAREDDKEELEPGEPGGEFDRDKAAFSIAKLIGVG